jgi:hypothetical protein
MNIYLATYLLGVVLGLVSVFGSNLYEKGWREVRYEYYGTTKDKYLAFILAVIFGWPITLLFKIIDNVVTYFIKK